MSSLSSGSRADRQDQRIASSGRLGPAGVWAPVLIADDPLGRLDVDVVARSTEAFATAGLDGVYTGDTASEFYALEFDEWNELASEFRAIASEARIASGIGCTWTNQAGAVRRVARAAELRYDNIHLSEPYWIKLNPPARTTFWSAIAEVAGDLEIVVYGGGQGQLPLDADLVADIRSLCPAVVGTKTTGFDATIRNALIFRHPTLAHFVGEQVLTGAVASGAAGCFSNLAGLNPGLMVRWFTLMRQESWAEAFRIQRAVDRFYEEGVVPIRRAGYSVDKAMASLNPAIGIERTMRPPYQPVPEPLVAELAAAARRLEVALESA